MPATRPLLLSTDDSFTIEWPDAALAGTRQIPDGSHLTVDGSKGTVRIESEE